MSQPYVYKAISVTATTSLVNLLDALKAVDSTVLATYREVNLQADPGNGAVNIVIGDDLLTPATRAGVVLTAGSSRLYRQSGSGMEGIPVSNIFIESSSATGRLNVELLM